MPVDLSLVMTSRTRNAYTGTSMATAINLGGMSAPYGMANSECKKNGVSPRDTTTAPKARDVIVLARETAAFLSREERRR